MGLRNIYKLQLFGMAPIMIAAHHKSQVAQRYLVELEAHRQENPQLRVADLLRVGSREKSFSEIESLPLSSVALSWNVDLLVRLQQVYYRIDGGCKDRWRTLHHSKDQLSDISTLYTLVKCFAVISATWTIGSFHLQDVKDCPSDPHTAPTSLDDNS